MAGALLLVVRFHEGRYHGTGPWPPAPARLFQALVAGAAEGGAIPRSSGVALEPLEGLEPPAIVAPPARAGQSFRSFVPNNDLDSKGADLARVAEIRAPKQMRPWLFEPTEVTSAKTSVGAGIYRRYRGGRPYGRLDIQPVYRGTDPCARSATEDYTRL